MGMGEPLANYGRVWAAVERIHGDARPVGPPPHRSRPSASSPASAAWPPRTLPVNLAVSLHAANDELRDELVPINRRYPLAELHATPAAPTVDAKGRRLSFEWALIDGVNDRPADAAELAAVARPLAAHVNLIPLNPTPGYPTRGTPPAGVRGFRDRLRPPA